jgi:hypothetical protein
MELLLLVQVPPTEGLKLVVKPAHIVLTPIRLAIGFILISTEGDGLLVHPLESSVKVKVTFPDEIPVTNPLLDITAIAGFELAHVPPVEGIKLVVAPTHMDALPVSETVGFPFTVIGTEAFDTHPALCVNINVATP